MRFAGPLFLFATIVLSPGCDGCNAFGYTGYDGGPIIDGGGFGAPCSATMPCRLGLACVGGDGGAMTCSGAGTGMAGTACLLTSDCAGGLWCGPARVCATAGTGADGDDCTSTASCMAGLVCTVEGLVAHCRAGGTTDVGASCTTERDCVAGLTCFETPGLAGAHCVSRPAMTFPDGGVVPSVPFVPPWSGETCTDDTMSPPVAYFAVPRMHHAVGDFYRLPYPNDIRRTATGLDLEGHPAPPTAVGTDIVDTYLRASERDLHGFSTNPTVLFRFSRPYDWGTIDVQLIDVTPGAPSFGNALGRGWITTSGRIGKYICENWMGVHPGHGSPLQPAHTYAAILAPVMTAPPSYPDGGTPTGVPFAQAPDFTAMLGATMPTDVDLAAAWTAYAPLRMYLASPAGVMLTPLNAAVFTTQDPEAVMRASADVIALRAPPAAMDLVSGDAMLPSPCADGTPQRAFSPHDARFMEIHGHLVLPIFQHGTAPYLTATDGGGFMLDASGAPIVQRTENVCFAMTVPRTPMPATGYPVVIFGHGTGGSFTDAIRNGIAGDLASGDMGSPPTALVAIDFPEHGARRGTSTAAPQELFFNFANPPAARDNVAQGAVDLLSVLRFVSTADLAAAMSPTTTELKFDPAAIGLFTHSQGSTHAALALPYMTGVRVVVLSGEGGDLGQSLLTKHSPIDIARVLPFALNDFDGDGSLSGGEWHPMLGIFQQYFDSVDPVNYAYRLHANPVAPDRVTNVFMTYGIGDTYSTEATMQAYANAGDLSRVQPLITPFGGLEVPAPLMGNYTPIAAGETKTQGLRQYMPAAGMDGHFVAFDVAPARADVLRFLRTALAGSVPPIGM